MSLYERLGGHSGVDAMVRDLSDRIRVHPVLGPFFVDREYEAIVQHRSDYLVAILGGPEGYEGKGMRDAHRELGLTDVHMDAFLDVVRETLRARDASPFDIEVTVAELDRLRPVLVAPPPSAE